MTRSFEKGKGFKGKWSRMEWFANEEPILSPAERAEIYDQLRKKGIIK